MKIVSLRSLIANMGGSELFNNFSNVELVNKIISFEIKFLNLFSNVSKCSSFGN